MADKVVTVIGTSGLIAKVQAYRGASRQRVATATTEIAKEVFAESQREVPVDTGNLRASGRVEPALPERLTATVSYGGTAAGYAVIVHETHKTKSKYLERPARAAAKDFQMAVKEALKWR
ncbi:MAG: HK97 gp10 family phage protein [Trueperaceae bacterium]|nr:HK97 gp10 family phage protein [Trueperaceae bacterium]